MLNPNDALRVEYRKYGKRGNRRKNHIFKCANLECDNEIRVITSDLKKRTGFCRKCTKRNLQPFLSTYNRLKYTANKYHPDKEFTLTYEEFLFLTQIGVCYYCGGTDIKWTPYKGTTNTRTNLDRKDSSKGYTFNNVVVCCKQCNFMKRDWYTSDEFRAISMLLRKWREGTLEDREELMFMLSSWGTDISILSSQF